MLQRYHKILIGALAVQCLLVVLVFARGGDNGALVEHPLLPGFDAANVSRIQVSTTDGKLVDVAKKDGKWAMTSAFDFPVDPAKVDALVAALAKMSAAEPIATSTSRHKQLRVADDDYDRKITVSMGDKTATVLVGGPAGTRRYAMRFASDSDVYATTLAPFVAGVEPRDWIQTSYVDVPLPGVTKITIQKDASTFEMTRDDASKPWAVAIDGGPVTGDLDTAALDRLAMTATKLDATAPADPKRDSGKPTAKITIHGKDKDVIVDVIADATADWIHDESSPRAVMTDKYRVDDLLATATKDKIIKKPGAKPEPQGLPPGLPPGLDIPGGDDEPMPPIPGHP